MVEMLTSCSVRSCSVLAAWVDVPYSPALLLDGPFDASITDDAEFGEACECGFDAYFEELCEWDESGMDVVLAERVYTWEEVAGRLVENALAEEGDQSGALLPLVWRAGIGLGWLSAHALVNRQEAIQGLAVLAALLAPARYRFQRDLVA